MPGGEIKAKRIGRARRRQRNEGPFSCYKRNTLPWPLSDEMRDGSECRFADASISLRTHEDEMDVCGKGFGEDLEIE
ncbi:hypothetical protein NPIL_63321 [Nephila pilipes]|uniref:Uncharacterized protein n=1 Tax=Nephila pilipes TaxID=299642 RepID=A0A8X6MVR4_NEPPI|nr:hypothetical protein NPIL_63321 [Nephila pilipes]